MPFFKCDAGLIFFFHIPKCGGSSVEHALQKNGHKLSFFDTGFMSNMNNMWYKSSPQHITYADYKTLFKEDIFFYKFTVVREPVSRFLSAFNANRFRIGKHMSFKRFLSALEKNITVGNDYFGKRFDNHFLPSSRFIPEQCDIFYLEKDMQRLQTVLSRKTKIDIDMSVKDNVGEYKSKKFDSSRHGFKRLFFPPSPQKHELCDDTLRRIRNLYREDYERFNFEF